LIADELAPQRPTRETTDGLVLAPTCGSPQPDPWRLQRLGHPLAGLPWSQLKWRFGGSSR